MNKLSKIIFIVGAILITIAAILKELHLKGKRELFIAGAIVILIALLIFLYTSIKNKPTSN